MYSGADMAMFNRLADTLETAGQTAVTEANNNSVGGKAKMVNMVTGFGDHGACPDPTGNSEDINAMVTGPTGPGDFQPMSNDGPQSCEIVIQAVLGGCLSRASFHPKNTGAVRQAQVVTVSLTS